MEVVDLWMWSVREVLLYIYNTIYTHIYMVRYASSSTKIITLIKSRKISNLPPNVVTNSVEGRLSVRKIWRSNPSLVKPMPYAFNTC